MSIIHDATEARKDWAAAIARRHDDAEQSGAYVWFSGESWAVRLESRDIAWCASKEAAQAVVRLCQEAAR